jgi:hypothetical protein
MALVITGDCLPRVMTSGLFGSSVTGKVPAVRSPVSASASVSVPDPVIPAPPAGP